MWKSVKFWLINRVSPHRRQKSWHQSFLGTDTTFTGAETGARRNKWNAQSHRANEGRSTDSNTGLCSAAASCPSPPNPSQSPRSNPYDRQETEESRDIHKLPWANMFTELGHLQAKPTLSILASAPHLSLPLIPFNQFTNLVILFFYPTALFKDLLLQPFIFLNSKICDV